MDEVDITSTHKDPMPVRLPDAARLERALEDAVNALADREDSSPGTYAEQLQFLGEHLLGKAAAATVAASEPSSTAASPVINALRSMSPASTSHRDWRAADWVGSLGVSGVLAESLLRPLQNAVPGRSESELMRALGEHGSREDVLELLRCDDNLLPRLAVTLWNGAETLGISQ